MPKRYAGPSRRAPRHRDRERYVSAWASLGAFLGTQHPQTAGAGDIAPFPVYWGTCYLMPID